jgi:acyl carrier protein
MDTKSSVEALITTVIAEFNDTLQRKIPTERGLNAPLYGPEGALDSLGFVSFIVAVEQAVEEELGITIVLADEKAMSQRNSPFRSVGTLVDYVTKLISEQEGRQLV